MNKVNRVQELRRSNAATPIRNKKKYTRKNKYKNKFDNQLQIFGAARFVRFVCQGDTPFTACDFYLINTGGYNWRMSVGSGILPISRKERGIKCLLW